jgi:hypothetical protein
METNKIAESTVTASPIAPYLEPCGCANTRLSTIAPMETNPATAISARVPHLTQPRISSSHVPSQAAPSGRRWRPAARASSSFFPVRYGVRLKEVQDPAGRGQERPGEGPVVRSLHREAPVVVEADDSSGRQELGNSKPGRPSDHVWQSPCSDNCQYDATRAVAVQRHLRGP